MSHITAIGTANPSFRFSQSQIAEFMVNTMQLSQPDSRKLKAIFAASGIDYRYSVLEDYGRAGDFSFYPNTPDGEPFPSTSRRLAVFRDHALTLSCHAVNDMLASLPGFSMQAVTHLIVVCCTGMYAPGLDIELVSKLGLRSSVQRMGINFMGCYAAFNALKAADAFCKADPDAKVLIVCTELCSLHFQRAATDDNLLANALFADGSAAVMVEAQSQAKVRLTPRNFCSELATDGANDMAWAIGDFGFEMRLSTYVPDFIKGGIGALANVLLQKIAKQVADIRYFAIHPGGKKILESVEQALKLSKDDNRYAYDVLRRYGNMSSPTILFVLKEIFANLTAADDGQHILSFAFGPGLTLESAVLTIETT